MKIVIYFVNGVKVIQKQGVLKFDLKNQQSTCTGPPITYNQTDFLQELCEVVSKKQDTQFITKFHTFNPWVS